MTTSPVNLASDPQACERLAASSLGAELAGGEIAVLAGVMGERQLAEGEILAREGAEDHRLYLLAEGALSVTDTGFQGEVVLYRMRPGETAGTRAFVDRRPRNSTLRADTAATVYYLEPAAFEALLASHPQVVYKVMRAIFLITHANLMRMNQESDELANYVQKAGGRY